MIELIKLDDGTYVPREWCTETNPATSGGVSQVDDVDMFCAGACDVNCSDCTIQQIFNEYAALSGQCN